ncbi:ABC transporter substrate-binding protein [Patescibacteria group bacterium]
MNIFTKIFFHFYSFLLATLPTSRFTEGIIEQPRSFLPTQARNQTEKTVSSLIFRGLFKHDIYGTAIPDLADTWEVSEDGLIYTIKLRENQYWTNGKKISSDDLIYTSFKSNDLAGVATDKVDDLTVRFTLPNKYAPFLSLLTVGIMPANAEEELNPLLPVSSADFRVVRVERSGDLVRKIILANTNPKANLKKLVFKFYSNDDELVTAAKLGEIDAFSLGGITDEVTNFIDYKYPVQGIYYSLYFNLRNEKFEEKVFRQRLEGVLSMENLIAEEGIAVQGPVSRSLFTDRGINFDKYDKDIKDDYDNLVIEISVPDVKDHVDLVKHIKEVWESKLNLDVKIKVVDPDVIIKDVIETRNFEILFYGQEVGRDPDRYVLWHSAQKKHPGLNITGFEQIRADRALEEGRNELENEDRLVHYSEFQKVVVEEVPAIFLYHPYSHHYITQNIIGIGEKYTFTYADRFLDFNLWKKEKIK